MSFTNFEDLFASKVIELEKNTASQEIGGAQTLVDPNEDESINDVSEVAEGTLYWSNQNNRNSEYLMRSFQRLLKKNMQLNAYYRAIAKDDEVQLNQFLSDFFPQNIPCAYSVANLSIKDKSEDNIKLAIRLPNHGSFVDLMPPNSTISIRGYWPVRSRSPVFIPEHIFATHNDEEPASYEAELLASASSLPPERGARDNVLTRSLAQELPPISVKTGERLNEWMEFIKFKRALIKEKTIGLRYLQCNLNNEDQLEFLVVGESKEELLPVNHVFQRKYLEAYELGVSTDKWQFNIDDKTLSRNGPRGIEIGQIKGSLQFIDANETKKLSELLAELYEKGVDKPILGLVTIQLSEEWKNKFDNADRDGVEQKSELTQDDNLLRYKDLKEELLSSIPSQGFISFPSVGDLALIKRHEQAIKNLQQNEGCYSPYLSSYLFDVSQAGKLEKQPEIDSWFNEELNGAQKLAVAKMMGAPDLCMLQGPPGTGKTTVIAEAILQLTKNGETVLLASQSHDAIDNALSCIHNHPELRAIRLARGKGKITKEGEVFSEYRALERYYDSLHHHVRTSWIEPQHEKQKQLESIRSWIEKSEFLSSDISKSEKAYSNAQREYKKCCEQLNQARNSFEEAVEVYDDLQVQQQATESAIKFLDDGSERLSHSAQLPNSSASLIQALFRLTEINVKLPHFDQSYVSTGNTESQVLILGKLLPIWRNLNNSVDDMRHDLLRLQVAGNRSLQDERTESLLVQLNEEVERLTDRMDSDDSPELADLWRTTRRKIKELKQQQSGLDTQIYTCFSDAKIFDNISNASKAGQLLSEKLNKLETISYSVQQAINVVIDSQMAWLQKNRATAMPKEDEVKHFETSVAYCEQELRKQEGKLQILKNQSLEHLKVLDLRETDSFEEHLNVIKGQAEELSIGLLEESEVRAPWEGFFSDWASNLSEQNTAKSDWEHIESTFVENCNLVAISCNEGDKTYKDAGVESFDTVIIDEVSKATPVELLLPLMRARRAILVGDHRQLPPVFQESQDAQTFTDKVDEGDSKILTKDNLLRFEKMVTASLFKEHFENADPSIRERLTVQYRMHPQIMKIVNNFYEGQLECGNPEKLRKHNLHLEGKNNTLISEKDHVLWIDTSNDLKGNTYKESAERTNKLEARLIANTLVKINEQSRNSGYSQKKQQNVGVVSFYAAQCRVIRDEIKRINGGKTQFDAIHVEINTVIRYQGKEKPIILISLVRNDGGPKEKRRSAKANVARYEFINVAVSRAQNLLIVFGARNMLEQRDVFLPKMDGPGKTKSQVYRKIFGELDRSARIFPASEMQVEDAKANTGKGRGRR